MAKEQIPAMKAGKELSEGEIEALVDDEAKQGCEYGTYADGEDKVFTPKEEMMTTIIHEAITDIGELEEVEVKSAFPKDSESILSDQVKNAIDKLIKAVPDKNDTAAINYWVDMGDKIVYIEGWIDKCLAGTGFPDITEGGWSGKIDYMFELTKEILPRKAKERNFTFLEGGFRQFEAGERAWLYGVTWGIYGKHLPKWVSRKGERT